MSKAIASSVIKRAEDPEIYGRTRQHDGGSMRSAEVQRHNGVPSTFFEVEVVSGVIGPSASLGSFIAQNLLLDAIYSDRVFTLRLVRNDQSVYLAQAIYEKDAPIEIDVGDISQIAYGSVQAKTFDASMMFLHELVHLIMGLDDPPRQFIASRLGHVSEFMNLIRKELGYVDRRLVYGPVPDANYNSVLPFTDGATTKNVILP